mmetsp:Transcript_16185/g.48057  ORF Transcript_16185/g.48057 Transcript_16185/m.48057 type:complete len:201 (-) Transcript_16185:876-1478(-)
MLLAERVDVLPALLPGLRGRVVDSQRRGGATAARPHLRKSHAQRLEPLAVVAEDDGAGDVDHLPEADEGAQPIVGVADGHIMLDALLHSPHLVAQVEHVLFVHQRALQGAERRLRLALDKVREHDVPQRARGEQAQQVVDLAHFLDQPVCDDRGSVLHEHCFDAFEVNLALGSLQDLADVARVSDDGLGALRTPDVPVQI